MKNTVFIVDDHPFTRAGVRSILETDSTIEILGEAVDGLDAVVQVIEKKPAMVVMDINMPQLSGIEATKKILSKLPDIKIIALSIHKGEIFVKKMLDAGASAYLLKDEAPEELLQAIHKVNKGDIYLSSGVTRAALNNAKESEELSKITVLQSKLQRPAISFDYVVRPKIIYELESNILKPLTIVSAGAGYGKSVAVSQWLEQTEFLYSWISLDEEHNDFRMFLHYLIAAVEKIFPGILKKTRELVQVSLLPPENEIANTLINELCDIDENYIIVLDDYHLITQKKIHNLLDAWLRFPPQSIHLCIITRRDPPLSIRSLRLSGRMTDIRMDKLIFNFDEISELFKQVKDIDLNDKLAKRLFNKTEGWIIGLRLLAMLTNNPKELDQLLKSTKGGLYTISEYLLTEVLLAQPEHIQDQLIATSILERFSSDLFKEIIEPSKKSKGSSGEKPMQWLIKKNLFVIHLDNEQKWFRYQHMFQDFLLNELKKRRNSEYIRKLHAKASLWFERNGFIEDAIDHAMKAANTNRVVEIIGKNWEVVSDSDSLLTVDRWLSYLPENVIQSSVNLLFARFYSAFKGHKLTQLPSILELILESKAPLSDAEMGYLAFINSFLNYYSGAGEKSLAEAEKALQLIPKKYSSFIGDARTFWFLSMLMIGREEEALAAHKISIDKFIKLDEPVQLGRTRTNIGFYALLNADLPLLKSATEEMSKTPDLSNFMLGFYRLNLQYICWFSDDMEGVVRMSEGVINVKYEFTSRLVIDCYMMKALALQELNKPDLAANAINDAIQFADYTKDPANLIAALSGSARLQLKQGEMEIAIDWLDKAELSEISPSMLWCVEVPEITRCRVLIARGQQKDLEEALDLLIAYRKFSESIYSKIQTVELMILQGLTYKKLGQENEAYQTLKSGIELAAGGEWIRPFVEQHVEISDLLLGLKDDGLHPNFIDTIFESNQTIKKAENITSKSKVSATRPKQKDNLFTLTRKELEVLKLIAEGLRNQEIADKLFNSEETIKKHIYHMFQKLAVKNRLSLVSKAKEEGIIE